MTMGDIFDGIAELLTEAEHAVGMVDEEEPETIDEAANALEHSIYGIMALLRVLNMPRRKD